MGAIGVGGKSDRQPEMLVKVLENSLSYPKFYLLNLGSCNCTCPISPFQKAYLFYDSSVFAGRQVARFLLFIIHA